MLSKKEIRKEYRSRRLALEPAEIDQLSIEIGVVLQQSGCISNLKYGHFFMPISKNNEPNCLLIQQQLKGEIHWHTGIVDGEQMKHVAVHEQTKYMLNKWHIPEPQSSTFVPPQLFDFVLIPLLAVDCIGNRVGYGKGYYDQFLMQCKPTCKFIGISFFEPVQETLATDPWDIRLHHCVTPKWLHTFTTQ